MDRTDERALTRAEQEELRSLIETGLEWLGFPQEAAPEAILYAVYRFVQNWQDRRSYSPQASRLNRSGPDPEAIAKCLGTVWGEQVVRLTDWEWVWHRGGMYPLSLVSPQREYVIHPVDYLKQFLLPFPDPYWSGWEGHNPVALFERIQAGNLPASAAGQYQPLDTYRQAGMDLS